MDSSILLSEIKTLDHLLLLLTDNGWSRYEGDRDLEEISRKETSNYVGKLIKQAVDEILKEPSAPYYEIDKDERAPGVTMYPELKGDTGDWYIKFQYRAPNQMWFFGECHAGSALDIDPETVRFNELVPRLWIWLQESTSMGTGFS